MIRSDNFMPLNKWFSVLVLVFIPLISVFPAVNNPDPGKNGVIVLCYHTFSDKIGIQIDFKQSDFSNQIIQMKELGYRFVSIDDLTNNSIKGITNILITIDDGKESVRKIYDTVLVPNGIKPILFIYPAIINRMKYALTYNDLHRFVQEGATIGGHGYYHLYVAQKLFKSSPVDFNKEIYRCKSVLEKNMGFPINIYAYPFGLFSDITKETLNQAGFQYAFSLRHGVMSVPLADNPDPYDLPRYMVTRDGWKPIYNMLRTLKYGPAPRITEGSKDEKSKVRS